MNPKTIFSLLLAGFMAVVFLLAQGGAHAQTPTPDPTATPGPIVVTLSPTQQAISCAASTVINVNVTQGGTAVPNGTQITIAANPGTVSPASLTTTNGAATFTYFSPATGTGNATLTATALSTSGTVQIGLFCGINPGPGQQVPGARLNAPVVQCLGTTANVTFSWTPVPGAEVQYVDLSLSNNGFAGGTFIGFGPLSGTTTTIQWNGLVTGQAHFYRVSAGVPGVGWVFSQTGVFTPCGPTAPLGGTSYQCTGGGRAAVTWGIATPPLGTTASYVDITLQDNGFLPGTFIGQNATGQQFFTWTGILANAQHFWRVNHLTPQGWVSGGVGSFFAAC